MIDSGIRYNHSDLKANIWQNPGESGRDSKGNDKATNGIDDDRNGFVDDVRGWDFLENDNDPLDDNGHGTHCAGTIGAEGNNGGGIAGMNWTVSLLPLRFLNEEGGTVADAVAAIEYATMMKVNLTSNSWGSDGELDPNDPLYLAIKAAGDADILFVAAAGNDGRNIDVTPTVPAAYDLDNIISVAAGSATTISGFSNFGPESVDIIAPGNFILSTGLSAEGKETLTFLSGTSMAAPFVSGTAALLLSHDPSLSAIEVKSMILDGVTKSNSGKGRVVSEGLLNVFGAFE